MESQAAKPPAAVLPEAPEGSPAVAECFAPSARVKEKDATVAGNAGNLAAARDCVSDELRRILDEEKVTYSWRRKGSEEQKPAAAATHANAVAEEEPADIKAPPFLPDGALEQTDAEAAAGTPTGGAEKSKPGAEATTPSGKASGGLRPPKGGGRGRPPLPKPAASNSTSLALLPSAGQNSAKNPKSGSGKASMDWTIDLPAAQDRRSQRCSALEEQQVPKVALQTYDGSKPSLAASPALDATELEVIKAWFEGNISSELMGAFALNWIQGHSISSESCPAKEGCALPMAVGMTFELPSSFRLSSTLQAMFADGPKAAIAAALEAVRAEIPTSGQGGALSTQILVSELEHALSKLESKATGACGHAEGRLALAIQRELLRRHWACSDGGIRGSHFDDAWLCILLGRTPQAAASAVADMAEEDILAASRFLDTYLMRLLRLKRDLSTLLDLWDRVDYYSILGVSPDATDKELKHAYRKACLRLHPDKGGDKTKFQQLQDAYARILEERAQQRASQNPVNPQSQSQPQPQAQPSEAKQNRTQRSASTGSTGQVSGQQVALENGSDGSASGGGPVAEVLQAESKLRSQSEAACANMQRAEKADAVIKQLQQLQEGDVEALRQAQEAGEDIMKFSQEVGSAGPAISDLAMEVAESALSMAAQFSAVPASVLLTDIALSCTLEASRVRHAAEQLLLVRKDTQATLTTLQTNLQMAKLIGKVDAETMKLSLALVSKAARRILVSLRAAAGAITDAQQRAKQCCVHAKSVAAFASRRGNQSDDGACENMFALEGGCQPATSRPGEAPAQEASKAAGDAAPSRPAAESSKGGGHPEADSPPMAADSRRGGVHIAATTLLQNETLLRQLNTDLLALQQRVLSHLHASSGSRSGMDDKAQQSVFVLVAEVLETAVHTAAQELGLQNGTDGHAQSGASVVDATLARCFSFVELCGKPELSLALDIRTQLVKAAAHLNAQAVLDALRYAFKTLLPSLLQSHGKAEIRVVLEQRFDLLSEAVVAVKTMM